MPLSRQTSGQYPSSAALSQGRRLWLILPLSPWRVRTSSWWLLLLLACVRWWSAAHQPRIRFGHCERRAADLPLLSLSACEAGETSGRHIERRQILLLDDRERVGELTLVTPF